MDPKKLALSKQLGAKSFCWEAKVRTKSKT